MKTNLDIREKAGVVFSGLALLLVFCMALYIPARPRKQYQQSLEQLKQAHHELVMTQKVKQEEEARLLRQETLMKKLEARPPTFDLFTFINRKLQETNLMGRAKLDNYHARALSAKQPMVQLKLEGVNLKELTDFLHLLYSSGNVIAMYKMDRLRPAVNGQGLDCDLTFMTIKP